MRYSAGSDNISGEFSVGLSDVTRFSCFSCFVYGEVFGWKGFLFSSTGWVSKLLNGFADFSNLNLSLNIRVFDSVDPALVESVLLLSLLNGLCAALVTPALTRDLAFASGLVS